MARRKADDEEHKARAQAQAQAQEAAAEASGSDDEAPEEFSKDSAKEQALRRLQQEEDARQQAAAAADKRKRKARPQEESTAQKEEDEGVAELPADVLSAVAAQHETDAAEEEEARERTRKRHASLQRKQMHVRQFGNVQVRTLASAEAEAESHRLSSEADAFLARRAAPHRERMSVLEGHASLFTKKQKQRAAQRA